MGLGAGILGALAMVTIRRMSASEPAIRIVFYFTFLATLISTVPIICSWQTPQPAVWWLFLLIGILAVAGQFLPTKLSLFIENAANRVVGQTSLWQAPGAKWSRI